MIDTHCHILPGLDDGPTSWDESLLMAQRAVEDGVTTIIATPHYVNGLFENSANQIFEKVNHLNTLLKKKENALKIVPGSEIHFYDHILEDLAKNKLISLNYSPYLLLEFPNGISISKEIERYLFKIQLKGYIPIIAHIERCIFFYDHIDILEEWQQRGIQTQLTSASLNGVFGREVKEFAIKALKRGVINYLMTDAHSLSKFGRKPILSEGLKKASLVIGQQQALKLVTTNPEKLLTSANCNYNII